MKFSAALALSFISLSAVAKGTPSDTSINGVAVIFSYSTSIFPVSWQAPPINAKGKPLTVMIKALEKYPAGALKNELTAVYFLKSMAFYDVGYGGTNSTDNLYLTNDGAAKGYTSLYLEQTFHHEYSSILYRNHPTYLNETAWKNANIDSFDYNDPENGVGAIRNNESSQDLDQELCKKGFLTQYSLSGLENDINTFPRINKKLQLLIAFYNKIDPLFTEEYFRKLIK